MGPAHHPGRNLARSRRSSNAAPKDRRDQAAFASLSASLSSHKTMILNRAILRPVRHPDRRPAMHPHDCISAQTNPTFFRRHAQRSLAETMQTSCAPTNRGLPAVRIARTNPSAEWTPGARTNPSPISAPTTRTNPSARSCGLHEQTRDLGACSWLHERTQDLVVYPRLHERTRAFGQLCLHKRTRAVPAPRPQIEWQACSSHRSVVASTSGPISIRTRS